MSLQLEPHSLQCLVGIVLLYLCEISGIRTHGLICIKLLCTGKVCLCLVVFGSLRVQKSAREIQTCRGLWLAPSLAWNAADAFTKGHQLVGRQLLVVLMQAAGPEYLDIN